MADVRRLARNINVDVSVDNVTWLNLPGRVDNAPALTPNKVDSTDVDTDGFTSNEITLVSGVLTIKYNSLINAGTPNPAQQLVEDTEAQFGDAARLYVRWYDNDGGSNGHTARAIVEVARAATAVADLRAITATFTLDGTVTKMSSADITTALANSDVPVITSVTPSGAGTGELVTVKGANFTGATGVTIDLIAMTDFQAISDSTISAILPSDTAGTVAVVVTTAAGSSVGFSFTRAA